MADFVALGGGGTKGFGMSLNRSTFQHVERKHYRVRGGAFVPRFEVSDLRVRTLPVLANPAGAPPSVFTEVRTAVGQTADRLIKPSSRDPSLKPTKQIKDKDGERQIDAGWGCVKGVVKAIDH